MVSKQKLIIAFLTEHGASSTTRIASAIMANHWLAVRHLSSLEKQGIVQKRQETIATYWNLAEKATAVE